MFGRQITLKLKPNTATELIRINDNEIVPTLRKQKGFRDEILFVSPERLEAVANTSWDSKEDVDAYARTMYSEVLKSLTTVIDGTPTIKTFEFASSTFHEVAAAKTA